MMQAEITPAALALVALLVALFLHDFVSYEKHRRLLLLQGVVFAIGGTLIVFPEIARRLAHAVGIGRGVDFVIYPLVIWLVRETLLTRRRRLADEQRVTELVRALAAAGAHEVGAQGVAGVGKPAQSVGTSASCTE
ncbi:MAG: DUF2304 domain-containing protein [Deltaproteobacteria bacterium]|nr:DUF2304 domain-containing protein [Deltaproteobacteria bacterium]